MLWRTLNAIDIVLDISFPLNDTEKLNKIEKGFSIILQGKFVAVLWVDGRKDNHTNMKWITYFSEIKKNATD